MGWLEILVKTNNGSYRRSLENHKVALNKKYLPNKYLAIYQISKGFVPVMENSFWVF